MNELTARQSEVLQLIADFLQTTGFPPTRAEIAAQLGFRSANAAEDHLRALERKGYIEMLPGASRGIRLRENLGIPVVGRVAAGSPILAEQHIQGQCPHVHPVRSASSVLLPWLLAHLERLNDVLDADVVVADADAALVALADLGHVILEPA